MDELAEHTRHRHHKTREIDLAEEVRVVGKGGGIGSHAAGKKSPECVAAQIEQKLRNTVGAELCDVAEEHHISNACQQGVDKEPQRPQNGLHVADLE